MRKNRFLIFFTLVSFILNIFSVVVPDKVRAAESDVAFVLEKAVDNTTVYPGEEFTYTIKYRNANITTDARDVIIKDELPSNIKYVSFTPSADIESTNISSVDGRDIITFKFKDRDGIPGCLKAGVTGIVKITAKFPEGTTLPGDSYRAENSATIEGSNATKATSNIVTVTPKIKSPDWKVTKTRVTPSNVEPTIKYPVTYRIDITGNSTIGGLNLHNVVLVDKIPAGAKCIFSSDGGIYDDETGKVTWNIGDLAVGVSESRIITLSYLDGNFDNSSSVTNTAEVSAKLFGSDEVVTQSSQVSHGFINPTMAVGNFSKYGRQDNDRYSLGQIAKFWMSGIENTGNAPIDKIQIIDDIPEDLELKSISTGAYSGAATVEVQYKITKSAITSEGESTDETGNGAGTEGGNTGETGSGTESGNTGETENGTGSESGNTGQTESSAESGSISETGSTVRTESIIGVEAQTGGESTTETEDENWVTLTETPVDAGTNKTLPIKDIHLNSGEKLSIRWIITNGIEGLEAGFKITTPIAMEAAVKQPASGSSITNNASLTASKAGFKDIVKTSSKTISVIDSMPWLIPQKTVKDNQVKFNMNDSVEYTLTIKNHDFATGNFVNPIGIDVLPQELEDVQLLGWDKCNSGITKNPETDISQSKTIEGKTYQILKWNFTGTLKPGEYVKVTFSAKIKDKTLAGKVTNKFYITTNEGNDFENPDSEELTDSNNLDGDSSTTDKLVLASKDIFVSFVGSVDSQKWVKGELDSDWGYYGDKEGYGKTLPGGIADYRLKIKNTGANGPISNLVFIDILPYIGDTGVIDSKARASEWRPYLVNKITGEGGGTIKVKHKDESKTDISVKVYYSTNAKPSKQELTNPITNKGLTADGWSETPPSDITTVRALKFDFGNVQLQPDDEVILEWPMRAPYAAPTKKIAWNSFGYGATYPDVKGQEPFLPSEPKKVGFEVQPDPKATYYIGDFVWEDKDKNGVQDSGEAGINGVLVRLYGYNSASELDASVPAWEYTGKYTRTGYSHSTGKAGYYEFPNLSSGKYKVQFVFPKNYKVTPYKQKDDRAVDSNIDKGTNEENITDYVDNDITKSSIMTDEIEIIDKSDFSVDAGFYQLASLGDRVWNDKDINGKQDVGEIGIENVVVALLNEDGTEAKYGSGLSVFPVKTDSKGNYKFEKLEPGKYKVKFTSPNRNYKFTEPNRVTDDALDSDALVAEDGLTAISHVVPLLSAKNDITVDAGMYLAQIGDTVWHDTDADGVQGSQELGISGVKVNLLDEYGNVAKDVYDKNVAQAITDSNGKYLFDNLKPGKYIVKFEKSAGFDRFTEKGSAASPKDSNTDSDADKGTGTTAVITLDAGERNMNIDAGMYKLASLGDFVWNDKNANGIQDSGESGIEGISVKLLDKSGDEAKYDDGIIVSSDTTDVNGKYSFDNLKPGIYKIQFTNANSSFKFSDALQKKGTDKDNEIDSDAVVGTNESIATTTEIILNSGITDSTIDAGLHRALIGDTLWHDLNGDGIQDTGEPGMEGIKIELLDKNNKPVTAEGKPITSITDLNGKYEFNDLEAGEYRVKFNLPTGYTFSKPNTTGIETDSDADATTGITKTIVLSAGQVDKNWDAGVYIPAELGDFVWLDKNNNGVQDAGEPGIERVTVKLLDKDGNQAKYADDTAIPDAVTDSHGKYSFKNLVPGSYIVQFGKASYYNYTETGKSDDKSADSDADKTTGKTASIVLKSDDKNDTVDAGYTLNANIQLNKTVYIGYDKGKGTGLENVEGEKGTLITYLFTVTNTGASYLNNIKINDDILHINETNMKKLSDNELLAPGETLVYYYETTISKDMTNTATAIGIPSDDKGTGIPNGGTVSSTDTAVIGELISAMKVEKTVYAGHDHGDRSGGELVVGEKGTDITYMFKITNTGNVALKDITVEDTELGIDKSNINKSKMIYKGRSESKSEGEPLGVNQTITYYYETTIDGDLTNTVKVEGTPSDNGGSTIPHVSKASAEDTAVVDEVNPSISVEKTVYNGQYSEKGTGVEVVSGKINTDVTYVFTVKNIGDTILDDITIDDIDLGIHKSDMIQLSGNEPLATDASIVYYYEGKVNGDLKNTVAVSGKPVDDKGKPIPNTHNPTASDTAEVKLSASLGDYIWADTNVNGKQDPGEKGIPKVKVILTDSKGNTKSTDTDDNGKYLFDDLMPGTYTVTIDRATIPAGMAASYELDITLDNKVNVTLSSNQFKDDVDFGYYTPSSGGGVPIVYKLASVGDYVWYDKNGDGEQGLTEKGIPKVVLTLKDENGRTTTASTDDNGKYLFEKLMPGTYTITLDSNTLPEDFKQTWELDNSLNGEVSVTLAYNDVKDDVDFGYNKSGINIDDDKIPGGPSENPPDKPGVDIEDDKIPGSPADLPADKSAKPLKDTKTLGDSNLPKTGTENFNLLLLGIVSLTGSGLFILRRRRKGKAK